MKNLKSKKKYLQVYDELKEYIDQNLKEGDKLPTETKLCEQMGISRNVLREAIKALEITGVIRSKPGVGMLVCEYNSNFFMSSLLARANIAENNDIKKSIEEIRRVLEIGYAREAFDTLTKNEINKLQDIVKEMRSIRDNHKGEPKPYGLSMAKADSDFHSTLFSKVDNTLLSSIIDAFWAFDKYYKQKATLEQVSITVNKHERILNALLVHDFDAFYEAMLHHFNYHYKN